MRPGLSAKLDHVVVDDDTALALRSGSVPVLATPRVVALCEEAACSAVEDELGETETTVGTKVQIDHLAPTAPGNVVHAEACVEKVAGRRITFTVSLTDERGLVAVGRVTRVIVDIERFLDKTR